MKLSDCCNASATVCSSDEGTMCFICDKCKKPCDVHESPSGESGLIKILSHQCEYCTERDNGRHCSDKDYCPDIIEMADQISKTMVSREAVEKLIDELKIYPSGEFYGEIETVAKEDLKSKLRELK